MVAAITVPEQGLPSPVDPQSASAVDLSLVVFLPYGDRPAERILDRPARTRFDIEYGDRRSLPSIVSLVIGDIRHPASRDNLATLLCEIRYSSLFQDPAAPPTKAVLAIRFLNELENARFSMNETLGDRAPDRLRLGDRFDDPHLHPIARLRRHLDGDPLQDAAAHAHGERLFVNDLPVDAVLDGEIDEAFRKRLLVPLQIHFLSLKIQPQRSRGQIHHPSFLGGAAARLGLSAFACRRPFLERRHERAHGRVGQTLVGKHCERVFGAFHAFRTKSRRQSRFQHGGHKGFGGFHKHPSSTFAFDGEAAIFLPCLFQQVEAVRQNAAIAAAGFVLPDDRNDGVPPKAGPDDLRKAAMKEHGVHVVE
ncbi:hypothetical protein [Eggerthella lenta]|uniref:hypothetical protein n=1 Tax=Eggerthella lenta TaxID=84112 RepID=UPI0011C02A1E|nr:hypothetical protein [Eggerthella lenta]